MQQILFLFQVIAEYIDRVVVIGAKNENYRVLFKNWLHSVGTGGIQEGDLLMGCSYQKYIHLIG